MGTTRRDVVAGGALALIWSTAACGIGHARSGRHNPVYGCTLPRAEAKSFFETSTETRDYVSGQEPMSFHSSDREFDYALAQTLARISDVFHVLPGFAYYSGDDSNNAYATREKRLDSADGTVLVGQSLLNQLLAGHDSPEIAVASVCAHEFGHILQYKYKLDDRLNAGQNTVKRVELQADYFAGYFAGVRKLQWPTFPAAVFALTQDLIGDPFLDKPTHHGTHEERGAAVVRGFEVAYREHKTLDEAIQVGTSYVEGLG